MSQKNLIREGDLFLIDEFFQPVGDVIFNLIRLTPVTLGKVFFFASLLFELCRSVLALVAGNGFEGNMDNALYIFINLLLYLIIRNATRFVRPNVPNPVREHYWGIRVVVIVSLLYDIYMAYCNGLSLMEGIVFNFADILFMMSLYFLSCNVRVRKKKNSEPFYFS